MPVDGVASSRVRPAKRSSTAATASAGSGPALVSRIVKRTVSPRLGAVSLTVLVSEMSDDNGLIATLSWSSSPGESLPGVESGSNWSLVATCATLTCASGLSTVTWTCSVTVAPAASVPTVQTPVDGSKAPPPSSLL